MPIAIHVDADRAAANGEPTWTGDVHHRRRGSVPFFMALDTFLLYLATWTLVALSPGPAVMFVMSQGARFGNRGAIAGTAGILIGHLVCFTASRSVSRRCSPVSATRWIRIGGALYLMYLGVRMMMTKPHERPPCRHCTAPAGAPHPLQGLRVQLTNPKLCCSCSRCCRSSSTRASRCCRSSGSCSR